MSLPNRFILPVIALALAVLAGCGGSNHSPVPPPSGGFSDTSLNGTYTFSVFGSDLPSTSLSPFAMVGTLTACGCSAGTISGGTVSFGNATAITSGASISSTGSGYSVTSDGRGKANLTVTTSGGNVMVVLDFVLSSSSHGLIIRFDGNGTGSGTIDLQSTVSQSSLANSYAVSLFGTDLTANLNSLAAAGSFTLDSSGNIAISGSSPGVVDFNHFVNLTGAPQSGLALSGTVLVGAGSAPGTASLASSFSANPLTFDVYPVDSTHLKVFESDNQAFLVGDVFTQTSASMPSGNLVFTMAGPDPGGNPFAAGGIVTSDGVSVLSGGAEDVNDFGTVDNNTNPAAPFAFSGTFSAAATGRGRYTVTLSNFVGGGTFVAYASDSGLLLLEMDSGLNSTITSGVALTQSSGATLAASQGYGMNLTAADTTNGGEIDTVAQFNTTASGMSGLLDENDFPNVTPGTANLSGSYQAGSNGTGAVSLNVGVAEMFYYAADNNTILFLSVDPTVVGAGAFQGQTTPSSQAAALTREHLALLPKGIARSRSANRQIRFRPSK